eukprot:CAMPEP_0201664398 /NCGR_PEP_ID=MMETSP0494-20130426/5877_1 /ASSEMBLY_ACC=CAM_ASM_000839 /TAXON_ID=420259 /ORGANISM="Thalassiosira gravida, Strain GMp14c1" /LENGTH=262 /DNA_ID=CAMNT_0048143157 /DNA_START=439 /DNA_END=1227 /DNA_ORIENTATION=-
MTTGDLYWRDTWSHRLIWLDLDHWRKYFYLSVVSRLRSTLSSEELEELSTTNNTTTTTADVNISIKRPWQKGDVVTIYNPYTESIVTKRIIGVGGDPVRLFGEYAHEYHHRYHHRAVTAGGDTNDNIDGTNMGRREDDCYGVPYGVPYDARFPIPFCQRRATTATPSEEEERVVENTALVVPPHHVWVEGDNPLRSTDSRHYGPLCESSLRGRVILRLWPNNAKRRRDGDDGGGDDDGDDRDGSPAWLGLQRPMPFAHRENE